VFACECVLDVSQVGEISPWVQAPCASGADSIGCVSSHPAAWVSGIIQTILYADFFYYYVKSWKNNQKLALPA
jgi:hypothetical protein